jgi:hypothetical protein
MQGMQCSYTLPCMAPGWRTGAFVMAIAIQADSGSWARIVRQFHGTKAMLKRLARAVNAMER